MGHKFRLCFRLPEDSSFTGDEESIAILEHNGESLELVAIDKEKKLSLSKRFVINGGPYDTVEEAEKAGEAARVALLYYAITRRVGINLSEYEPGGRLTDAGKEFFSADINAPVLDDWLGLTVFEAEPSPQFVRFDMSIQVRKSTQTFVKTMEDSFRRYALTSPRAEVAIGLFTSSFFENTPSARFLSLYMSLEVLLEPLPRTEEAQEHVDALIKTTKTAKVPKEDKESLLGALGWLKKESIKQTFIKLADRLLSGSLYDSLSPEEFFDKISRIRNDLVHRGIADPTELVNIVLDLEKLVVDILRHQFEET